MNTYRCRIYYSSQRSEAEINIYKVLQYEARNAPELSEVLDDISSLSDLLSHSPFFLTTVIKQIEPTNQIFDTVLNTTRLISEKDCH